MFLNKKAQVIEYNEVRKIISELGLQCRREGEYLLIFPKPEQPSFGLYTMISSREVICSLFVDEGCYTGTMVAEGVLCHSSEYMELFDSEDVLFLVLVILAKGIVIEPSKAMGSKRRSRDNIEKIYELLKHRKEITWVD